MNDEAIQAEVAQTEKIGLGDLVIVAIIAALTVGIAAFWQFPGLYPGVWADATVASYLRPAEHVLPGYWTALSTIIYSIFGINDAAGILRLVGHIFLAGVAVCVYAVLREWLAFAMRMRPQLSKRRTLVMRMASAIGAATFVAADPIWTAGQCLSETTILLGLTLGAIEFYFVFLRKGTIKYAYFCTLLLGLLAAESPLGLFFPILFIAIYLFIVKVMPGLESPLFTPAVIEVGKWHLTFIFLASLIVGIALNCWTFIDHEGLEAIGESAGYIPVAYLTAYWHRIAGAGSAGAWILWLGVCILPFVVATLKFPASADEEQFLSYASGIIFFFCGLLSFSQSVSLSSLWFWTYFPMDSQYLLGVGLFCCAATVALSMTILGVDSLCRNHAALVETVFGGVAGSEEDEEAAEEAEKTEVKISGSMTFIRRLGIIVIPLAMLVMLLPGRVKTATREMLNILQDAVAEIVREAGDATYLFTDGNLDQAIELESARQGGNLKCYSLMGNDGALSTYLRTRNLQDEEDMFSFRYDTGMGLRSWIKDKPERLNACAALMGFDLWKRDGKAIPPMGGFLSLPTGFKSEEVRREGVDKVHALIDRILAVYSAPGSTKDCTDEKVSHAFQVMQWRAARMCVYRSEFDDIHGRAEDAIAEANRAKALNDHNDIYKNLVAMMEKRNATLMQKLTPREGLQLALVRADFTMGKVYAETILNADPENPDANFAMGMYYLQERQLSRAESYLVRCLIRKPEEPAVFNNLAMIQIELKKYDAAKSNIDKALKLIPDSAAVLDTKKALEDAIKRNVH